MRTASAQPKRKNNYPHAWEWATRWDGMVRLTSDDHRRLPRFAIDLLERLSGNEHREVWVDYNQLRWKLGINRRRMAYCVRALRDAGMAEVSVRRSRKNVIDIATGERLGGYGTEVWLRPTASCQKVRGNYVVWVLEESLATIRKMGTHGGKRAGAGRPRKESRSFVVPTKTDGKCPIEAEAEKSRSSIFNLSRDRSPDRYPAYGGATGVDSPAAGSSDGADEPDLDSLADILGDPGSAGAAPASPARRERIPEHQRGPKPNPPGLDPIPVRWEGVRLRVPDMPTKDELAAAAAAGDDELAGRIREQRVRVMVNGYNAAARKIFGPDAKRFVRPDLTRTKVYAQLVAAAEVLCDRDVPPGEWAEWRMAYAKSKGATEPPYIGQVFHAGTVKKLQAWWRKEFKVDAQPRQEIKRWHLEQMFRAREAMRRWEWGDEPDGSTGITAAPWYYAMRRAERARGELDPLVNWPSPNNAPMRGAR